MTKHSILQERLYNVCVCSSGSINDALEWLRTTHESGTKGNWVIDTRPCVSPVKCNLDENKMHYVFTT